LTLLIVDIVFILSVGTAVIYFGRAYIPFLAEESRQTAFFVALLAGTIMIANSPTVVIAMIAEHRARGPLAQTTLAFTVLKDLALIILFAVVTSVTRGVLDEQTELSGAFVLGLAFQLVGSVVIGAVLGAVMAWYVHRIQGHLIFFLIGFCMLFALIGNQQVAIADQTVHLEPLLMALSAGLLMQNLWPKASEPLFEAIEDMSLPVYAMFFGFAGAKVDLGAFAALWYVALALVALRAAVIWGGITLGCRMAGFTGNWVNRLWLGMIPQAGVTLVLITLISRAFERDFGWGKELASVLIAMLVVHELFGPIGFRYALLSAGEAQQTAKGHR
jgi:Kef-type K+ transport system membrane component KefB